MSQLFSPLAERSVTFRNRLGVSPMCQYSSENGHASAWHLQHLGSRAAGGMGLILQEATAISPEGRISPTDAGLWDDAHVQSWSEVVNLVRGLGCAIGVQLAHAGIKAGTAAPWLGGKKLSIEEGGWQAVGVTDKPFHPSHAHLAPRRMSTDEVKQVPVLFAKAARRAEAAGYDFVELHAAHGYLLHSFYSPLMNDRTDEYGGSWENRTKLLLQSVRATREAWPKNKPIWVRLSCSDWQEGGWTLDDSIRLAVLLKAEGVDLIDCSSGGASINAQMTVAPGYQVAFAQQIREKAAISTAAVGLITTSAQAEQIIAKGQADIVLFGRESLRDPHLPIKAALELGAPPPVPKQYQRAY